MQIALFDRLPRLGLETGRGRGKPRPTFKIKHPMMNVPSRSISHHRRHQSSIAPPSCTTPRTTRTQQVPGCSWTQLTQLDASVLQLPDDARDSIKPGFGTMGAAAGARTAFPRGPSPTRARVKTACASSCLVDLRTHGRLSKIRVPAGPIHVAGGARGSPTVSPTLVAPTCSQVC